jgi:hypothetical protein
MGKNKYIETPEKMYDLFCEYKKEVKDNPRERMDFKGKDAETVFYKLEAPLTMEGFENYVANIPEMPISLDQYFSNQDGLYKDYMGVCSRIRREIREDQITGGMVGLYNPSITQRLNNLVERKDHTSGGEKLSTPILQNNPLDDSNDNSVKED